jgi:hypothetical protein
LLSLCYRFAIALLSLCYRFAIALLSLSFLPSFRFRFVYRSPFTSL